MHASVRSRDALISLGLPLRVELIVRVPAIVVELASFSIDSVILVVVPVRTEMIVRVVAIVVV